MLRVAGGNVCTYYGSKLTCSCFVVMFFCVLKSEQDLEKGRVPSVRVTKDRMHVLRIETTAAIRRTNMYMTQRTTCMATAAAKRSRQNSRNVEEISPRGTEQVPVSAYGGSSKNLKDLKEVRSKIWS